jgi:rubrerythrin
MSFRKEVLLSELKIMMEKEREMRDLYDQILKKLENTYLEEKIRRIRDDEVKHMGYVEIIMSMFSDVEAMNEEPGS